MTELAKFHAEAFKDEELLKAAKQTQDDCERTAFESQLCRCLRKKEKEAQASGVAKYKLLYAHAPPSSIQATLWKAVCSTAPEPPAAAAASAASAAEAGDGGAVSAKRAPRRTSAPTLKTPGS